MDITNNNIVFKVSAQSNYIKFTYEPTYKRKKRICDLIDESNMFKSLGKSRIDGNEMYELKQLTIRRIKIDKIFKNIDLSKRFEELMNKIKDDIEFISIMYPIEINIIKY